MDHEEYTSDEGNYSSISSASGFSNIEDEVDFRGSQIVSSNAEKQLILQIDGSTNDSSTNYLSEAHTNDLQQYGALEQICKRKVLSEKELYMVGLQNKSVWNKQLSTCNINQSLMVKLDHELRLENVALDRKNKEWKWKFDALQKEINTLNSDKECRKRCILQLKSKIADQQEIIHDLTQQTFKCKINLSTLQNELTTTKSTVDWYKNEWVKVNDSRNALQKELLLLKSSLRNNKLELIGLRALLSDYKFRNLQSMSIPKNNSTESTEQLSLDKLNTTTSEMKCDCKTTIERIMYYILEIDDLNDEILSLRKSLAHETDELSQLVKEKAECIQTYTILQKQHKDSKIFQALYAKQLENVLVRNKNLMKTNNVLGKQIFSLKTQLSNSSIQLDSLTKERFLIQGSINSTRNSFHQLIALQDELKEDLIQKSKVVVILEKKIQDSFMLESWNKCAIEEFSIKEKNYTRNVKLFEEEIEYLKGHLSSTEEESQQLRLELEELKKHSQSVMADNATLIDKVEQAVNVEKEKVLFKKSEVLKHICGQLGVEFSENIGNIVQNIENSIRAKCQLTESSKSSHNLQDTSDVNIKEQMELRFIAMAKKNSSADVLIVRLNEEIQKLCDVIHVKEVELGDKQKRYEKYYHSLLQKVKQYKQETRKSRQENEELKNQQERMVEKLNSTELELFYCQLDKDNNAQLIIKKTERIHHLQSVLQDMEDKFKDKSTAAAILEDKYNELNRSYEDLVSTHSRCLSAIETAKVRATEKLITDKVGGCIGGIVDTQHALIEHLEKEKSNAFSVVSTLERLHYEDQSQIQSLLREKSFLQRLIIDMKSALNISTAKKMFNMEKRLVLPLDLSKYPCSDLPNEKEILSLLTKSAAERQPLENLQENVTELKKEVSNLRNQLSNIHNIC